MTTGAGVSDEPLTHDEIRVVRSILRGLSAAEWRALKAIASGIVGAMGNGSSSGNGASPQGAQGGRVATDYEMGGQYGDPTVRKDPKRWAGASYSGALYSHCPSDSLLTLADFLDWRAGQDSQKPDAKKHKNGKFFWEFDLKDAGLARGWANRNRGKDLPPPAPAEEQSGAEEPADAPSDAGEDWVPS